VLRTNQCGCPSRHHRECKGVFGSLRVRNRANREDRCSSLLQVEGRDEIGRKAGSQDDDIAHPLDREKGSGIENEAITGIVMDIVRKRNRRVGGRRI
jgi:hypothetical protein